MPDHTLDCPSPVAGGGAVCVQLLQALDVAAPPTAWEGSIICHQQRGGHPGGSPIHGPLWDQPRPPDGGDLGVRPGVTGAFLYIRFVI